MNGNADLATLTKHVWCKTLYQLIEQRQRLKKEAEQQPPLLKQLPTVIADTMDDRTQLHSHYLGSKSN